MQNEAIYVAQWIASAKRGDGIFDEILVIDGGSTDDTVERLRTAGIQVIEHPFAGHFADQRNFGLNHMTAEWILEVDADEIPSAPLLAGARVIIADADRAQLDCVGIPRLNFLDGTLVQGPGCKGLDYQYRLHQRACHWRGTVHEEITNYRARFELNLIEGYYLIHNKARTRHEERNAYYRTLTP